MPGFLAYACIKNTLNHVVGGVFRRSVNLAMHTYAIRAKKPGTFASFPQFSIAILTIFAICEEFSVKDHRCVCAELGCVFVEKRFPDDAVG